MPGFGSGSLERESDGTEASCFLWRHIELSCWRGSRIRGGAAERCLVANPNAGPTFSQKRAHARRGKRGIYFCNPACLTDPRGVGSASQATCSSPRLKCPLVDISAGTIKRYVHTPCCPGSTQHRPRHRPESALAGSSHRRTRAGRRGTGPRRTLPLPRSGR